MYVHNYICMYPHHSPYQNHKIPFIHMALLVTLTINHHYCLFIQDIMPLVPSNVKLELLDNELTIVKINHDVMPINKGPQIKLKQSDGVLIWMHLNHQDALDSRILKFETTYCQTSLGDLIFRCILLPSLMKVGHHA